jgi:hypothetical protein
MYILRIISRQIGGRHVKVDVEQYGYLSEAFRRAEVLRRDRSLTIDLYQDRRFIRHFEAA